MPFIFEFLVKQSISLAVIYLFYRLILRRLTFYNRNRWYLLGYSILCFLIPFINISPFLQKNEWTDNSLLNMIPLFENYTSADNTIASVNVSGVWRGWDGLSILLLCGIVWMLARLVIQLVSLQKMKKSAHLISENKIRIYQVDKAIIPFSFGNAIFINQHMHNDEELGKIISHEFVHVKQKHSVDIMWGELLCILNWFNPFAWLIRRAIRQNLEFIADNKVIEEGIDKKQYQYLLLKAIGNNHFSIANQFNFSSLKKRIAMMNKMKTARVQLIRFLFVLPVIAILLLAFRERFVGKAVDGSFKPFKQHAEPFSPSLKAPDLFRVNEKGRTVIDTVPEELSAKVDEVLSRFPASYTLYKTDEMTSEQRAFFERNPKVNLLHWKKLSLEVYLSNGAVEQYDLGSDGEKIEKKYGKLPLPGGSTRQAYSSDDVVAVAAAPVLVANAINADVLANAIATVPTVGTTISSNISSAVTVDGVISIASTAPVVNIDATVAGEKIIELKIYKKTKKEELDKLVTEAKTKGVTLEFDDPEYNDKGELIALSGTMKKDDAKSNFSATDFEILRLIVYKQGEHYSLRVFAGKKEVI